jgi:hypothetical protein
MKKLTPVLIFCAIIAAIVLIALGCIWLYMYNSDYDFHKTVPSDEALARKEFVKTAEDWLGYQESDGSFKAIIDLYNSHEPLAQNYKVKYDDEWCATFVSAVAIECELTDIIPTECGCQRQIGLFQALGVWEEADDYKPLPGDIIYYCWKDTGSGVDCTGWSDHVGIVVGTAGHFIKVIEGNKNGQVAYRHISVDAAGIRGYAIPAFAQLNDTNT